MISQDSGQAREWTIGVRISPAARAVCLPQTFHASSGAKASYAVGTGALPPGAKLTRA
jgi:hypothetical protein